jgi:predicted CoA-binding protein
MAEGSSKIKDFLAQKRIAVAGVSRTETGQAANMIYRRLRDSGYEVFAVNPKAEQVEGDPCFHDLKSIPGKVDGVVVVTPPEAAEEIVRECAEVGVPRAWMHRAFGTGSVSDAATKYCDENGIEVIPGGCPMMFCGPVDFGHKCMRWWLRLTGKLPR